METEIINQEVAQNINQPTQSVPESVFKKSKIIIVLAWISMVAFVLITAFGFLLFKLGGHWFDSGQFLFLLIGPIAAIFVLFYGKSEYKIGSIVLVLHSLALIGLKVLTMLT